jgi:hypothetical protein
VHAALGRWLDERPKRKRHCTFFDLDRDALVPPKSDEQVEDESWCRAHLPHFRTGRLWDR